ncbi:hypothetical protein QP426_05860 [Pauljensenia sp. UMB1235]|uniref:hypothetical protein n=1 Tax=unclassified Pauljensenia TaxID=2908895 RepID=UPI00255052D1|nr:MULTISPECIES: hypothetical protein [unclassified Pauljensenia]MDK6400221.1 hypothetical protein [Pauljensenia sp. UMB9872]MDK7173187.1 hypothetical protein [Pauljensenia sp. UMB1235]
MDRIKAYAAATTAGAIALVFVIIGVLALTVFQPAKELSSSIESPTAIIMTHDRVLPLLDKNVVVTATSKSGAELTLGVGTPGDVLGWIGNDPYTEVVGLTSDRSVLKVNQHEGAAGDTGQSGPQSGAQSGSDTSHSGAQSGAQPGATQSQVGTEPAQLVADASKSDMWLHSVTGEGTVSMSLDDVSAGLSVLAVSTSGASDTTLTLTWATRSVNTLAIVSFILAILFALIAGVAFLSRYQLLRHRAERAKALEERRSADSTDTQTIDVNAVNALADAKKVEEIEEASVQDTSTEENEESAQQDTLDEALQVADTEATDKVSDSEETVEQAIDEWATDNRVNASETTEETSEATTSDEVAFDAAPASDNSEQVAQAESEDSAVGEDDPSEETPEAEETLKPVAGRHGQWTGTEDQDPPEKVSTDTGIIDLSSIRPGVTLPSRRALREAREKGEEKIVIDGREFNTGLIPIVHQTDSDDSTGSESEESSSASRSGSDSWTKLLSSWLKKN